MKVNIILHNKKVYFFHEIGMKDPLAAESRSLGFDLGYIFPEDCRRVARKGNLIACASIQEAVQRINDTLMKDFGERIEQIKREISSKE